MRSSASSSIGFGRLLHLSALLVASSCLVWVVRRRRRYRRGGAPKQDQLKNGGTPCVTPPPRSPKAPPPPTRRSSLTMTQLDSLTAISPMKMDSPSPVSHSQRSYRRSLSEGPSNESIERLRRIMRSLPGPEVIGRRRIELLVHNVSHKDMVLSMADQPGELVRSSEERVLCRPKFSLFQPTSEAVLGVLEDHHLKPTVTSPLLIRERELARNKAYTLKHDVQQPELPVGFDLSATPVRVEDRGNFRFRRDDDKKMSSDNSAFIDGVYFPLLASIIPKWLRADGPMSSTTSSSGSGEDGGVCRIVFLVSGIGMPRDATSDAKGNSTEGTCQLIEKWMQQHYPKIHVVRVHSVTNIFRYDENIAFVKTELLPLIEVYRDMTAEKWGTEWRSKYRITISFADGSPARISAINASLRPYHPSFMHMWELKTFWHHAKMCLDDVELHSFEDIDTLPPVPVANVDAIAQMVSEEMMKYREEVLTAFRQGLCTDLTGFWLRKTKKPVLAVLLVQREGQKPVIYRGCNMEVSMPTGSLCAERNAIGSALAADLTLSRRDLKIVAVLSLSFKTLRRTVEAGWRRQRSASLDLSLIGTQRRLFADEENEGGRNGGGSHVHEEAEEQAQGREGVFFSEDDAAGEGPGGHPAASPPRVTIIRSYSVADLGGATCAGSRTISVDSEDLNPLKPCGACMEWLKKIAEKNPEFRVATFTDELCRGVYLQFISTEDS